MRAALPLALIAALAGPAQAACRSDAMLVFDGSGSMAGSGFVQNQTPRIEEARAAMARVLPEVEHHRRIGLVTYGLGGSCEGIALHFGPRDLAAVPILTALAEMTPQGLTPLAESVERAAEVLDYRSRPATVVLVTDGNDTCGGRPCDRIGRMQAAAADLTIHVLGFKVVGDIATSGTGLYGILPKGEVEARCMAEATGGSYTLTDTTSELIAALRAVLGCEPTS
ncbi:vWA domain-containing protein [Jannaschia seohaensis]|uniref:Ca-activated chloride channel family protein n=1 Tax=Jannaschia seohaensis TaxID=475081 RepID=A0A2Y9AQP1_9RHOB|nr:vWA domain-containing protein [Jannaschia seohaensis]PWJ18256.1 Ca-activated chloride channel family protein [Jannaschia seohaensis]SSA46781.1 Ca-activated chloride channel family protein [Jannaschia seohaensis]